jgi:transcriptional regulator with XRE-family HTH domain
MKRKTGIFTKGLPMSRTTRSSKTTAPPAEAANEPVADERVIDPGPLIRDLRRRMGVTLQQLAEATGRSVGFVSQIERGLSQPTVLDLNVIADRLGVPGSYFYALPNAPERSWITRPKQRRTLRYADGFVDHLVSPSMAGQLCVLESVLEPGADTGDRSIVEHLEQAVYVLQGQLTLWVNGEQCTLKSGDAGQLPGGVPTRYANLSKQVTRVLWVYC